MMGIYSTISLELIIPKTGIKKKQDDYNAWYYKTHKEKWNAVNEANLAIARENKDEMNYRNSRIAEERKAFKTDPEHAGEHEKNIINFREGNRELREAYSDTVPRKEYYGMSAGRHDYEEKRRLPHLDKKMNALLDIYSDRSKGINMVRYDMHLAAEKISSALNKIKHMKLR